MSGSEKTDIQLVLFGVSEFVAEVVMGLIRPAQIRSIKTAEEFMEFLELPEAANYQIGIAGALLPELSVAEIGQSLRGVMQRSALFFCHESRDQGFDRKLFIKNGFNDAFLFPFDQETFRLTIEHILVQLRAMPAFRSVRIVDIKGETVLDFDLYLLLPSNKKYIRYSKSGQALDTTQIEKLKEKNVGSIFVPLDQMTKFYDYSAAQLRALTSADGGAESETQKRERLQFAVRDLMTSIFASTADAGFEDGKKMLEDAGEIVKAYLYMSEDGEWYKKILKAIGEASSSYSHLSSVSTIATLFAMGTGVGKPEDLALAGLFHDLGMTTVPAEVQNKKPEQWTDDERLGFQRHPENTVNLIKDRKIVLPTSVQTMILQHHERADGKGYPLGIAEPKLKPESQVLAIADKFEELTCFELGKASLTPAQALEKIREEHAFNSGLIDKLASLFKSAA